MPQIINKTTESYVVATRALLADIELTQTAKVLYLVFLSLAQSCDNVFPSYKWLASQIGYQTAMKPETKIKFTTAAELEIHIEQCIGKYIKQYTDELHNAELVTKSLEKGSVHTYSVKNYHSRDPVEKSKGSPEKKVGGNPVEFSTVSTKSLSNKNIELARLNFLQKEKEQGTTPPSTQTKPKDYILKSYAPNAPTITKYQSKTQSREDFDQQCSAEHQEGKTIDVRYHYASPIASAESIGLLTQALHKRMTPRPPEIKKSVQNDASSPSPVTVTREQIEELENVKTLLLARLSQ